MNKYEVAGERRMNDNATVERFVVTTNASDPAQARNQAWALFHGKGYGNVHMRAVVPVNNAKERMGDLANAYWQERWKEGGTIELEDGKVAHSEACARLWQEMDNIGVETTEHHRTALQDAGVPEGVVTWTVGPAPITVTETSLSWTSGTASDGYALNHRLAQYGLRDVEEWCDGGARWVWTDGERLIVTYCEGDLSAQFFFTPEAYAAAFENAAAFYRRH